MNATLYVFLDILIIVPRLKTEYGKSVLWEELLPLARSTLSHLTDELCASENKMKKAIIVTCLVVTAVASIPLSWALFSWALSLSAIELVDGTNAILDPTAGRWIINVGYSVSGVAFFASLWVAIFYKPQVVK